MISTRQPKGAIPLHALHANQDILHGVVQGVAHVELTRNIGRRNNNGKGFFIRINHRMKIILLHPVLIMFFFNLAGIIGFGDFFAHVDFPFYDFIYVYVPYVTI